MRGITGDTATRRMLDTLMEKKGPRYATLSLPTYQGEIYLARRNTEPQKGLYSSLGGKLEPSEDSSLTKQVYRGSLKQRFQKEGFERLADSVVRETCEEYFFEKDFRWVEQILVDNGEVTNRKGQFLSIDHIFASEEELNKHSKKEFVRMSEHTRPQLLHYFKADRIFDAIFDATTGFYCSTFKVRLPEEAMPFKPSKREIEYPVKLSEIENVEEVNPITRFILCMVAKQDEAMASIIPERFQEDPTNMTYGSLEKIVFPSDFDRSEETGILQPSKRVIKPSFYIDY